MNRDRIERVAWWIFAGLVATLYVCTVPQRWQCEGVDEIEYLSVADSLARGAGYAIQGEPHVLYPPLWPWLLSHLVGNRAGVPWASMYGLHALLGAVGLILTTALSRRLWGRVGRWASWVALASYFAWSFSSRFLLSEPLFFALSGAVLWSAVRLCEGGNRRMVWGAVLLVSLLLSAATRFGTVSLVAGCSAGLFLQGLRAKRKDLVVWSILAAMVVGGFLVAWEVRGARLNPHASESYGRWMKAIVGGGNSDETGVIAKNQGEGVDGPTTFPQRMGLSAWKMSSYVLSIPRTPDNLKPLAVLFGVLLVVGAVDGLRRGSAIVPVLYVAASLAMIASTTWVSSYHRYFYPLTALLPAMIVSGGAIVLRGRHGLTARALLAVIGLAGLVVSLMRWPADIVGAEGLFRLGWHAVLLGVYLVLLLAGTAPARWMTLWRPAVWRAAAVSAILLLAAQAGALLVQRMGLTRADASPVRMNLVGPMEAGAWLRGRVSESDRVVSSYPRLVGLLAAARVHAAEEWEPSATPDTTTWIVLLGPVREVPGFRPAAETALVSKVAGQNLRLAFSSGDAKVFVVEAP